MIASDISAVPNQVSIYLNPQTYFTHPKHSDPSFFRDPHDFD